MNAHPSSISIRPMTPADIDRVVEIAASLPQAPHWPVATYLAAINPENKPPRIALIAERVQSPGQALGFLVAGLIPPEAELETIAVAAEAQNQGAGAQLMRALVAQLQRHQVTTLILEVRSSNRSAIRFYAANGFAETARRPRYYADPEEDAILMRRDLRRL